MVKRQKAGAVLELPPVSAPASVFFDSGSFTLWSESKRYARANKCGIYDYYDTEEFWQYMRHYAHFIKTYPEAIDFYANVDVIPNAELSYRNLKWLEGQGLKPVPVIHYTTDLEWITRHIDEGYKYIGLGGLVGRIKKASKWLDAAWNLICDTPNRLPRVKVHGFGVTQHEALYRYPWYSVDAASWGKMGAYGTIMIPPRNKATGEFDFRALPYKFCVSKESAQTLTAHVYAKLRPSEKALLADWLEFIGIPLGECNAEGEVVVPGVLNFHLCRRFANMYYYWHLTQQLPAYPWPFKPAPPRIRHSAII